MATRRPPRRCRALSAQTLASAPPLFRSVLAPGPSETLLDTRGFVFAAAPYLEHTLSLLAGQVLSNTGGRLELVRTVGNDALNGE